MVGAREVLLLTAEAPAPLDRPKRRAELVALPVHSPSLLGGKHERRGLPTAFVFPLAAWRLGLRRARGSIAKG